MEQNRKDGATIKIMLFVIGALFGAIVATSAFLISVNVLGVNKSEDAQSSQMQSGNTPPEMPSGQNGQGGGQGGTPPAMPGEDNAQGGNN